MKAISLRQGAQVLHDFPQKGIRKVVEVEEEAPQRHQGWKWVLAVFAPEPPLPVQYVEKDERFIGLVVWVLETRP